MKIYNTKLQGKKSSHRGIFAFTLIEVLITLTIMSLVFSSVMSVFLYYTRLGSKVETNRLLQSNIKTIIEHITADVRDHGILFDDNYDGVDDPGHEIDPGKMYDDDKKILYVAGEGPGEYTRYYLGHSTGGTVFYPEDDCNEVEEICVLYKEDQDNNVIALSTSWVSFKYFDFDVSKGSMPKVTMHFDMNLADGKGINTGLIESSSINIQTTISERILDKQ